MRPENGKNKTWKHSWYPIPHSFYCVSENPKVFGGLFWKKNLA